MLTAMGERGPDSAGFAVYRRPAAGLTVKLTLHHPDEDYPWPELWADLAATLGARVEGEVRASHCALMSDAQADAIRSALALRWPEARLMGIGESIEIYKEKGRPEAVVERFRLAELVRLARDRPHPHGDRERGHDRALASVLDRARPLPGAQRLAAPTTIGCGSGSGATASASRPTTTARSRPAI